ncbi:MAG: DUF2911 domain-containing protein [Acidobacteriota bacterium]
MKPHIRRPLLVFASLAFALPLLGAQGLTFPPNGDNPKASVSQMIGPVTIRIDYSSPRVVRGANDRKGKIWGELVPWGLSDLALNGCAACPWRGGANENTTFAVASDVKVQGQPLPAGTYGVHFIPGLDEWTVIFSKDADSWGSYWYDAKNDALRVQVKPARGEYHEWLTYEFTERGPAKTTLALKWEELQIPISIAVDNPMGLWVDNMRRDLKSWAGFSWQNWQQAAAFCAQNKVNLPEGLRWAERAVSDPYSGGQENFTTLATLSRLQALNGREAEAAKTFERAMNHGSASPVQIHQAGRQLMAEGKKEEAMRVFQLNARRFPGQWPVHVGLMRGYAGVGNRKKALEEARLALPSAPDDANRKNVQGLVKQLEEGKEIN